MSNILLDFPFWKMQGTGNDFIIFNLQDKNTFSFFKEKNKKDVVKKICQKHFSIGADGVVFICEDTNPDIDFKWEFYNADGTIAEMCGNAARCVGQFASSFLLNRSTCTFSTGAGLITANSIDDKTGEILINLNEITIRPFDVGNMGGVKSSCLVNTGVPHIVIELSHWNLRNELTPKIKSLRNHPGLEPHGANVTLMNWIDKDCLRSVTFERGVEAYTLSCGTGVMAAAYVALKDKELKNIDVTTPGGTLNVSFKENGNVGLKGHAEIIFQGHLNRAYVE